MNFWQIIEAHVSRPLQVDSAAEQLEKALRKLPEPELREFCRRFDELMAEAYRWDLWGIAYLVNEGCGDDSFMDFRASLICLGQDTFEAALADAESLVNLPLEELQGLCDEGMLYAGPTAYEAIAGEQPPDPVAHPREPAGEPWDDSREALMARFPKAWAAIGWDD